MAARLSKSVSKVFLSYRHESQAHCAQVRVLAERLRTAVQSEGRELVLDQFYQDEHPGGPPEGWNRWSANQAEQAGKIVIIGTGGWFRCFEQTDPPGVGLGAACEAQVIYNELYAAKWVTDRHRVVFLDPAFTSALPKVISHLHYFIPSDDHIFGQLVDWLLDRGAPSTAPTTPAPIAWPTPIPDFKTGLADRLDEWPAIAELFSGKATKRVLLLEGPTNHGKSVLVRAAAEYARALDVPVATLDFKGGLRSRDDVFGALALELKTQVPEFYRQGASRPILLRQELRALREPVLVILDTYEKVCDLAELSDWIEHQFLTEVPNCPALLVVIAGQKMPDLAKVAWRDHTQHFELGPIPERRHWEAWLQQHSPELLSHLETLLLLTRGHPGNMRANLDTIRASLGLAATR